MRVNITFGRTIGYILLLMSHLLNSIGGAFEVWQNYWTPTVVYCLTPDQITSLTLFEAVQLQASCTVHDCSKDDDQVLTVKLKDDVPCFTIDVLNNKDKHSHIELILHCVIIFSDDKNYEDSDMCSLLTNSVDFQLVP